MKATRRASARVFELILRADARVYIPRHEFATFAFRNQTFTCLACIWLLTLRRRAVEMWKHARIPTFPLIFLAFPARASRPASPFLRKCKRKHLRENEKRKERAKSMKIINVLLQGENWHEQCNCNNCVIVIAINLEERELWEAKEFLKKKKNKLTDWK